MMFSYRSRFKQALVIKSSIVNWLHKVTRGSVTAQDAMIGILRDNAVPLPLEMFEGERGAIGATRFLSGITQDAFINSLPENQKKSTGTPLGALAEDLVMSLTGDENRFDLAIQIVQQHPILNSYGKIEESYVKLRNEASTMDDWNLLLKTIALPLDDRVFYERASHLVMKAIARIGTEI
jgi:hypothetical protein